MEKKLVYPQSVAIRFGSNSIVDNFRQISQDDLMVLGELLFRADLGTVDDIGLPVEDSICEIQKTFSGSYGKYLMDSSFVAIIDRVPVAAVLFTFYEKESMPLLAFTMTDPRFKNRGLCKELLCLAFDQLRNNGYKKCFLAVNAVNVPAVAAYKKVGFEVRESIRLSVSSQAYWKKFLTLQGKDFFDKISTENPLYVESSFAGNRLLTDELISLFLQGRKYAGSSLVEDFIKNGDTLPKEGRYWIVLDKNENPKCILKTSRVEINKFKDITEEIALAEGEGDGSIAHWKRAHEEFFSPFLKDLKIEDLNEEKVITEFFEVVFSSNESV